MTSPLWARRSGGGDDWYVEVTRRPTRYEHEQFVEFATRPRGGPGDEFAEREDRAALDRAIELAVQRLELKA